MLVLTACSSGAGTKASVVGGTVNIRLQGDFGHLDIHSSSIAQGSVITPALYDNLVLPDAHGKLVPYLATAWNATPTTLNFTLRKGVTCSDGTPVTASVVKNSMDHLFNAPVAGLYIGPGPYSVAADDAAGTVTVTFGTPNSEAIYGFATVEGVICPAGIANADSLKTKAYGSGPFTLESAVHGDQVILDGRPDWKWGPAGTTAASSGFPQKLDYKVISNDTTAANLLLTGGLDLAVIGGPDVARLAADRSLIHKQAHGYMSYILVFNESQGRVTTDQAVREALATAVDPKAWNQVVNQGRGTISPSIFQQDSECFDPTTARLLPTPSVDRAKAILLADGYTAGPDGKLSKNGKPLTIRLNSTPDAFGPAGEYEASQWQKVGITVDLADTDRATYNANNRTFNWDATEWPLSASLPGQHNLLGLLTGPRSPAGSNLTGTADPVVDAEYKAALGSAGAEKCKHYANLQQALLTHYDILPLPSPPWDYFSRHIDFVAFAGNFLFPQYIRRIE